MTPAVRPVADHDWDAIVDLEAGTYGALGLSESREALRSRADASPQTCFVLADGDRLAGYVLALPYPAFRYPDLARAEQVTHGGTNLHLHDLVVAPGDRGTGLASSLLGHLTATAAALRYTRISLVAVAGSDTFWAARGFRAHPEVTPHDGYGGTAVYMSTTIGGGAWC